VEQLCQAAFDSTPAGPSSDSQRVVRSMRHSSGHPERSRPCCQVSVLPADSGIRAGAGRPLKGLSSPNGLVIQPPDGRIQAGGGLGAGDLPRFGICLAFRFCWPRLAAPTKADLWHRGLNQPCGSGWWQITSRTTGGGFAPMRLPCQRSGGDHPSQPQRRPPGGLRTSPNRFLGFQYHGGQPDPRCRFTTSAVFVA